LVSKKTATKQKTKNNLSIVGPTNMTSKLKYSGAWIGIFLLAVSAAAVVIIPAWLIQPFAPQTQRDLDISFFLRTWSPTFTLATTLLVNLLAVFIWLNSRRWVTKIGLIVPLVLVLLFTWLARQNHFEWMFNPLASVSFVPASSADFVADNEMVLAVNINGDAVAFPVRQMAYHHIVQDVVGGRPITATY
jgi:Protein of unknown function (DUF3179)